MQSNPPPSLADQLGLSEDGSDNDDDGKPSKSARKRQAHLLQAMGEQLLTLKPERLQGLPLSEQMMDALELARRIRPGAREGRRRQMQLIGKLMRQEAVPEIAAALDADRDQHRNQAQRLQTATRWRDRLVSGEVTWPAFVEQFPQAVAFENVFVAARKEREQARAPTVQRQLYREILKLLVE
ncbi:MAG: ribosome biogenesis factor YjgA [Burkholderiaceae bacterium]